MCKSREGLCRQDIYDFITIYTIRLCVFYDLGVVLCIIVLKNETKGSDMLCAEKIHRLLMAIMVSICMVLFVTGATQIAVVLQTFIVIMLLVWAFTDFCPSLWMFSKTLKPCDKKSKSE